MSKILCAQKVLHLQKTEKCCNTTFIASFSELAITFTQIKKNAEEFSLNVIANNAAVNDNRKYWWFVIF